MTAPQHDPAALPERLLTDPAMVAACREREFGTIFELVRAKAGIHAGQIAKRCDLYPGRVGDILKGRRRITDMDVIERIADGLRIPGHMLGLADRMWETRQPEGNAADAPALLPATDSLWPGAARAAMSDPDLFAIQIEANLPGQYQTANLWGARHALDTAMRQAAMIERIQHEADGPLRDQVLRIGARVAEFIGWLYQDLGDFTCATHWSDRAMEWSQETGDDLMAAYVLFRKSHQAAAARQGQKAIGLARAASRIPGLTPHVRALIVQQEAHGHALTRNHRFAEQLFDEARTLAAEPYDPAAHITVDASYCTTTYVEMQRANCLIELEQPGQAVALFTDQLNALPATFRNDHGVYRARLARAHAAAGDPDRAAGEAMTALAIAYDTESARALDELRNASKVMQHWHDVPSVATFHARLDDVTRRLTAPPAARR